MGDLVVVAPRANKKRREEEEEEGWLRRERKVEMVRASDEST